MCDEGEKQESAILVTKLEPGSASLRDGIDTNDLPILTGLVLLFCFMLLIVDATCQYLKSPELAVRSSEKL